jgi:predicted nucleic acid-binding protein
MIILDNTVLSSFAHIDRLDILPQLFGEVIIPESVYSEGVLTAKKSERVLKIRRSVAEWRIKVLKPTARDIEVAKRVLITSGIGER